MPETNSSTIYNETELGEVLNLPLPDGAYMVFTRANDICTVLVDFNFSAGRMSLEDRGDLSDAPEIVRRCWTAMRDRIAGNPYYDKWEGGLIQRYSVRRREKDGRLHIVSRTPGNFTFRDKDAAIEAALSLRNVYVATDYIVTGHTPSDEHIVWEV